MDDMKFVGRIRCSLEHLHLDTVLRCGQAFRWRFNGEKKRWTGAVRNCLWCLQQQDTGFSASREISPSNLAAHAAIPAENALPDRFAASSPQQETISAGDVLCWARGPAHEARLSVIEDYLSLHSADLRSLYSRWSQDDPVMAAATERHRGVRVLRQDPVETLFAFVCSSNNNIARISTMLERLCEEYGMPLGEHDGRAWFSFPEPAALAAEGVMNRLRQLGFGYRAEFVTRTASQVSENGGRAWLASLRHLTHGESQRQLRRLHGVGAKVADCVCLMALDQHNAVPVDTHVLQLVQRHYLRPATDDSLERSTNKKASLSESGYKRVVAELQKRFPVMTGWAQAVLFCADLPQMTDLSGQLVGGNKKRKHDANKDEAVRIEEHRATSPSESADRKNQVKKSNGMLPRERRTNEQEKQKGKADKMNGKSPTQTTRRLLRSGKSI